MAIPGQLTINVGVPNEAAGSDSLYSAFSKTKNNFANLFNNASPYNTFTGNTGISIQSNSTAGTVDVTNTGVTQLNAGTNIVLSGSNGNITISSIGGGGGSGTVTSVGLAPVSSGRLVVTGAPIVSSGTMNIDLATTGVSSGSYVNPNISVDLYGRITSIANGLNTGTVSSVGITPGFGIQVTDSPVTSTGNITVVNTGVTRLYAGTGIVLSGSNGNVTVSTATGAGTVTSVGVSSTTLTVTSSPITAAGTITIDIPSTISLAGTITGGNLKATSTGGIGYATGAGGTVTQSGSRTSTVIINKTVGSITLVSAAGSASYQTFTVTNSTVAATDVIIVNQKSGTDKYEVFVTAVATGSFNLTYATTGGTTVEQPVFNFAVIKGVTS